MNEAQIIEKDGRKVFAVLPYRSYRRMREELEDYACLKALQKAKDDPRNRRGQPFVDFARVRGYLE